jgi:hypothetical protein
MIRLFQLGKLCHKDESAPAYAYFIATGEDVIFFDWLFVDARPVATVAIADAPLPARQADELGVEPAAQIIIKDDFIGFGSPQKIFFPLIQLIDAAETRPAPNN